MNNQSDIKVYDYEDWIELALAGKIKETFFASNNPRKQEIINEAIERVVLNILHKGLKKKNWGLIANILSQYEQVKLKFLNLIFCFITDKKNNLTLINSDYYQYITIKFFQNINFEGINCQEIEDIKQLVWDSALLGNYQDILAISDCFLK